MLALALVAGANAEIGGTPDAATWVTDGPVHAIARSGDRTFIGGDFSYIGPRTGPGVQLASDGTLSPPIGSFPEISGGSVLAVASDESGGWYVGGDFTHVAGAAHPWLAHLVPNGAGGLALDQSFVPRPDGPVHALAVGEVEGKDAHALYIGGSFGSLDGDLKYRNFAVVDRASGAPLALTEGPNGAVNAIDVLAVTLQPGTPEADTVPIVFIAGPFDLPQTNVAAIWGLGASEQGADTGYQHVPSGTLTGAKAIRIGPLATNGTQVGAAVYVAGEFGLETQGFLIHVSGTSVGGTSRKNISPDARPDEASCFGCLKSIDALAVSSDGGLLYLGGAFTRIGSADRTNLMAITGVPNVHAATTSSPGFAPKNWDPAPDGQVSSLLRSGATLYAGGAFEAFANIPEGARVGLAALTPSVDTEGTNDLLDWDPRATGGAVHAIADDGGRVYAGGGFTSVGGSRHDNVAALDSSRRPIDTWNPSTDGRVNTLAVGAGRVYLGGGFDHANGQPRTRLAAVDELGSGALDGGFSPAAEPSCTDPGCPRSEVFSLSLRDTALYVGGAFARLAGASRANAGAVDASTGAALGWAPNPDGNVYSLLATCGTVYAGGGFDRAGGSDRRRLAALDPQTGVATTWNPSVESGSAVRAIARDADLVYVGGNFTKVGGAPREDLAALDAASGQATGWNPGVPRAGEQVWAIAAPPEGSVVFAGGRFTRAGRADRAYVAALDRASGDATSWNPSADAPVRALAADGGSLAVGGDFRRLGPLMQHGFGSFGLGGGTGTEGLRCAAPPPPPPPPEPEPPPPPPPPPPVQSERPADMTAPQLTHVRLSHRRFVTAKRARLSARRHRRVGTTFKYRLSEPAVVRYTFQRKLRVRCRSARWRRACGRWPRGKARIQCRSHRWQRRCYRWRRVGSIRHFSEGGPVRHRFRGRVGDRWLRLGRYRVRLRAADLAGNRSRRVARRFRIVRR